jgi:hypothetical protein
MSKRGVGLVAFLAMALLASGCCTVTYRSQDFPNAKPSWRAKLDRDLPLYGHRNWICVVDSAYPAQSRAGIDTLATGEEQIKAVEAVLEALGKTRHVRPVVYVDAELEKVSEADAPGVGAYRQALKAALGSRPVQTLPHEEIIAKLDDAAKTFRVLILKTNLCIPYTSVFFQLDCGYWGPEAEKKLREAMPKPK